MAGRRGRVGGGVVRRRLRLLRRVGRGGRAAGGRLGAGAGCTVMSSTVAGTSAPSKNMTSSKFGGALAGAAGAVGPPAIGDGAADARGLVRLERLAEAHAGDAVDVAQARQQRGDLLLAGACSP